MKCKVNWCKRDCEYPTIGVCGTHYYHLKNYGKILKRTFRSKNKILKKGKQSEIIILGTDNKEKARAIIDTDDIERIKNYKWGLSGGYICTHEKRLHRIIMNVPKDKVVDHINHNRLDNRKQNLRNCTRGQNSRNTKNSLGVTWLKQNKKWMAQIMYKRKQIYLGSYFLKEDALKARKAGELKYFGEYANKINQ